MPRNALLSPIACGSSMAVAIRSSRSMSSMSNALRICVQPARNRPPPPAGLYTVKLGLHRFRGRRHLAQCERSGEDFDEESFHGEGTYGDGVNPNVLRSFWLLQMRGDICVALDAVAGRKCFERFAPAAMSERLPPLASALRHRAQWPTRTPGKLPGGKRLSWAPAGPKASSLRTHRVLRTPSGPDPVLSNQ